MNIIRKVRYVGPDLSSAEANEVRVKVNRVNYKKLDLFL